MKVLGEYECDLYIPNRFLEELLIIKLTAEILMVLVQIERFDFLFRKKIIFHMNRNTSRSNRVTVILTEGMVCFKVCAQFSSNFFRPILLG